MTRWIPLLLCTIGLVLQPQVGSSQEPAPFPVLGWSATDPGSDPPGGSALAVRLTARWDPPEGGVGLYDWERLERRVAASAANGAVVSLCLDADETPSPLVPGSVDAWVRFVREAVRRLGDRVAVVEVLALPSGVPGRAGLDADVYAYLLKQTALAIRAESERIGRRPPLVAQGAVDARRVDWQRTLWSYDTAPYVDILPVRFGPEDPDVVGDTLAELSRESLNFPPAPKIWARIEHGAGRGGLNHRLSQAIASLSGGAETAITDLPPDAASREAGLLWLSRTAAVLVDGYAPAPPDPTLFFDLEGGEAAGGQVLGKFFSDRTFQALVVYSLAGEGKAWLQLPSPFVRNPYLVDPVGDRRVRTSTTDVPGGGSGRRVRVDRGNYPLLLEYQAGVATPGFELETENLEVERDRDPTAQEIIARHQAVQKIQDDYLERWTATARVDYHFKFAQSASNVDVSIDSNYFWARGRDLEWEQTAYAVNGTRVPWKKFPELPLIQPEKVVTLPMDLTLDRTYRYRLTGRDRVEDRDAWVLAFEPVAPDPERPLYSGRVWIDRETFVRLKVALVQDNLEAPVLINEERDLYRLVQSGDGTELSMLSSISGQQVWTAGGLNFLVHREVTFQAYDINPDPERFESARQAAYRSDNQMLRDTDTGFRYLERQEDGTRKVKEEIDTNQVFAAAGLFKDNGLDNVVPLAGADYFDYDLFGRGLQANLFFAGVFLNGTVTDPDLFGTRIDLTLNILGSALKFDDKVYDGDRELLAERIRARRQGVTLQAGVPVGRFAKLNLTGGLRFVEYDQEDEAEAFRGGLPSPLEFVLPPDHTVTSGTAEFIYNRRGYTFAASQGWFRRSEWERWGLYDPAAGGFVDPDSGFGEERYVRRQAGLNKEWFLPHFQKLRAEVTWLDGEDLDRFSQYEFSYFGETRLSGYSGSGVRFDRGGIFRVGYSFNVFDVLRLDATVQTAEVENELVDGVRRRFTGAGLSVNTPGPWKTYFVFNYGRAISADIPGLDDQQEYMLTVLKLF